MDFPDFPCRASGEENGPNRSTSGFYCFKMTFPWGPRKIISTWEKIMIPRFNVAGPPKKNHAVRLFTALERFSTFRFFLRTLGIHGARSFIARDWISTFAEIMKIIIFVSTLSIPWGKVQSAKNNDSSSRNDFSRMGLFPRENLSLTPKSQNKK